MRRLLSLVVPGLLTVLVVGTLPVAATTASQLVFTQAPAVSQVDGVTWSSFSVAVSDGTTTDVGASGTITASLTSTTAQINGSATVSMTSGVATFSNFSITGLAGTYTVSFSATGSGTGGVDLSTLSALNVSVTVATGAATALKFLQSPPTVAAINTALTPAPVVAVVDVGGNVVTSATGTPSVSVTGGNNAAAAVTGTSVALAQGQASYGALEFTGGASATPVTLTFSLSGLSSISATLSLSTGVVTQLVVSQSPSTNTTDGVAFSTQPVISLEDANGVVVPTTGSISVSASAGAVTFAAGSNNLVNGVATFSAFTVSGTSGSVTLTFTPPSALASVVSPKNVVVVVSQATPSQLVVTTQPTKSTASGAVLTTEPVVAVTDTNGNPVASLESGVVSVTVSTGFSLSGTTAEPVVNGVASFAGANLAITGGPGSAQLFFNYSLGNYGAISQVIAVVGPASKLGMATQPSASEENGVALVVVPQVQVEDAAGNLVLENGGTVTASVVGQSGAVNIVRGATATLVNGVATFSGLTLSGTVGSVALSFSYAGLTAVTSNAVTLTPGAISQLALTTEPSSVVPDGSPFGTQPVVKAEDASGNVVTTASGTVTARVTSGSALVKSGASATMVNGVANFSGLTVSGAIGSAALSFTATGTGLTNLTQVTSTSFQITNPQLTVTTKSLHVMVGQKIVPSVLVTGLVNGDQLVVTRATFTFVGTNGTTYAASTQAPTKVGSYQVIPSNVVYQMNPSNDAANYQSTINYVFGTLTIQGATLTATTTNLSVKLGSAITPHLSITGLKGGDRARVTHATFTYRGVRGTNYGPSEIAPTRVGTYSVSPSNVAVAVTPSSRQAVYGDTFVLHAGTLVVTPNT